MILKFNPVFNEIFFLQFFEFVTWNPINCLKQYLTNTKVFFTKTANKFEDKIRMSIPILARFSLTFLYSFEIIYLFWSANNQDYVNWSNMIQMKYRKIKAILPIQYFSFREIVEVINNLIVTCNIITTVTFASKCTQSSPNANSTSAKFH